ncbi:MAG TPA: type II secretion system protein GspJ [Methylomirabilota bacterium]|nr:type II secretion system protein GspJ [Methylomirabilota bacterium]
MKPGLPVRMRSGFTLLELLIAVAAFAIVLAAINTVFYGAVRLRNRTATTLDESLPLEHTLAYLRRDLAALVPPGGVLFGELQTTPTATSSDMANRGALPTTGLSSRPGVRSPEFHTATGALDDTSPWAEVQRVSYFLAASTNGSAGSDLFRSVTRNLLPSFQEPPSVQPLLTGVQGIYFTYSDGTQWKDSWDSTTEPSRLPVAIKVQIQRAAAESGRPLPPPVELVVPILVGGAATNDVTL